MKILNIIITFLKYLFFYSIAPFLILLLFFFLIDFIGDNFGKNYQEYFIIIAPIFIVFMAIVLFIRSFKREFIEDKSKNSNLTKKEFFITQLKNCFKAIIFFIMVLLGLFVLAFITKEYFLNIVFFIFIGAFTLLIFINITEKKQ